MTPLRFVVSFAGGFGIAPRLRLYCCHHAGGSATSFARWSAAFPDFEVRAIQLPHRFLPEGVKRAMCMDDVVPEIVDELLQVQSDALPFAFYGHSLGALLAFELTRALRARGGPRPIGLAISGHRAPHRPLGRPRLCELGETAFIERLRSLGGVPESAFADARMRSLILPTLRADLRLSEIYDYRVEPRLSLPLIGFRGLDDPLLGAEDFSAWGAETTGESTLLTLPGHHFLGPESVATLQRKLSSELRAWMVTSARENYRVFLEQRVQHRCGIDCA